MSKVQPDVQTTPGKNQREKTTRLLIFTIFCVAVKCLDSEWVFDVSTVKPFFGDVLSRHANRQTSKQAS